MNCGYFLPPMSGPDLPNWPCRDPWQPFLGSIRTYVHTGGATDFESFKRAMKRGRIFTSGGPMIDLEIDGQPIGRTVHLDAPGKVRVSGNLRPPRELSELTLIQNGRDIELPISKFFQDGIHVWEIEREILIEKSSWIALSARGSRIETQDIDETAHTNAIRVIVNGKPIRSNKTAQEFIDTLQKRKTHYQDAGAYKSGQQRQRALKIFDKAIPELEKRL